MCQCNSCSNRAAQRACERAERLLLDLIERIEENSSNCFCGNVIRNDNRIGSTPSSFAAIANELCEISIANERAGCF